MEDLISALTLAPDFNAVQVSSNLCQTLLQSHKDKQIVDLEVTKKNIQLLAAHVSCIKSPFTKCGALADEICAVFKDSCFSWNESLDKSAASFMLFCTAENSPVELSRPCTETLLDYFKGSFYSLRLQTVAAKPIDPKDAIVNEEKLANFVEIFFNKGKKQIIQSLVSMLLNLVHDANLTHNRYFTVTACFGYITEAIIVVNKSSQADIEEWTHASLLQLIKYLDPLTAHKTALDFMHNMVSYKSQSGGLQFCFIALKCVLDCSDHCQVSNLMKKVVLENQVWCLIHIGVFHSASSIRKVAVSSFRRLTEHMQKLQCFENAAQASVSISGLNFTSFHPLQMKNIATCQHLASVFEALEENQIHVVKPIFAKIKSLCESEVSIPFTWFLVISKRLLSHESKLVQKEGVSLLLNLNYNNNSLLKETSTLVCFVITLLQNLRDDQLYYTAQSNDENSSKEGPSIVTSLPTFLSTCLDLTEDKALFLKHVVLQLTLTTWSPVSLFYVSYAIHCLPETPAWGNKAVEDLGCLTNITVRTHHPTLRKTIQKMLLNCFFKFADPSNLSLSYVLKFFHLNLKESTFTRNSELWSQLVSWVNENFFAFTENTSAPQLYILKKVNGILEKDPSDLQENEIGSISLCALLLMDGLASKEGKLVEDIGHNIMLEISTITDKAATHAYLSESKILAAFSFIHSMFDVLNHDRVPKNTGHVTKFFRNHSRQILVGTLEFITRKILTVEQPEVYLQATKKLIFFLTYDHPSKFTSQVRSSINAITDMVSKVLQRLHSSKTFHFQSLVSAYKTTHWCLEILASLNIHLDKTVAARLYESILPLDLSGKRIKSSQLVPTGSELVSYCNLHWCILPHVIHKYRDMEQLNCTDVVHEIGSVIDSIPAACLHPIYSAAKSAVCMASFEQTKETETEMASCIKCMWKTVKDLITSSSFRTLYSHFVAAVFQPCILAFTEETPVYASLCDVISDIISLSDSKSGLLNAPIKSCVEYWSSNPQEQNQSPNLRNGNHQAQKNDISILLTHFLKSENLTTEVFSKVHSSALNHCQFLIHCLTYSPAPTKDSKSSNQAIAFACTLENSLAPPPPTNTEAEVNLTAIKLLHGLNPGQPNHQLFALNILNELLVRDEDITKAKPRHHFNSPTHLVKQKLWQGMILLFQFVPLDKSDEIVLAIIDRLKQDMQASVRHLMEWSLALLLFKFPNTERHVFKCLNTNILGKKGAVFSAVCSYLTAALLVGISKMHSKPFESCTEFFIQLINCAIPWCMTQHFSVRLYASAVLLRVRTIYHENDQLDFLQSKFPFLEKCLEFAENSSGNVGKNWHRIKESFMLFHLHPLEDFSLETILHSIPRLCLLDVPEISAIEDIASTESWIPVHNPRSILRNLNSSNWIAMGSKKLSDEPSSSTNLMETGNVQKKIVTSDIKKKAGGLVLVASLIDKPSNLGGLTRTCEVFGAEKMVVHSLSCTSDKLFQSLSVTAHKWLKMSEVKRWELEEYLESMKREGYALVATEQTEQSVCLTEYKFPPKCVILLGNEKEGIPPNLLRMCDACIEIPQVGVVRSLNVHVSGGITVWEFTRQKLLGLSQSTKT
ncbi:tRNA (guanosine(18)-2'-O)-methyltransferase TARBP1 [Ciona intestinalis]